MTSRCKFVRLTLRLFVAFIAIILLALFLCLDTVDQRPYLRQGYYTETMARLRASAATNIVVRGELSAGFGRARLTPTVDAPQDEPSEGKFRVLPMAGYGGRKGTARGAHDDLFVKAVALRVGNQLGVMVGMDTLIVPREVADAAAAQLERELGLRRDQLYLSATHTHCSLGGWGEGLVAESFAGKFQPGARTWLAGCIVAAVRDAVTDLRPAAFGAGQFAAPEFVRNRVVGQLGKVDPQFCFALVRQTNGRTAVLGSFAAHATVLSSGTLEFSADYPGYWQRSVEAATGGLGVFLAGAVGSHAPVPGASGFEGAERMGEVLAGRVLEQLAQIPLTNSIAFGRLGLDVTLPPSNVRVSDGVRLRPWVTTRLVSATRPSFLQVFRLDRSVWISTPCDFSGELALGVKDFLQVRGFQAVITSFNGDYVGYVIPARYYHLDGYEPRTMSFYGPTMPDYFDELMRAMALHVAGTPALN